MTIDSHAIVHPDNRLWRSDVTRWGHEAAGWQRELTAAELACAAEAAESRRQALECGSLLSDAALIEQCRTLLEGHRQALEGRRDRLCGELAFLAEYEVAIGGELGEPPPETVRPTDTLAERVARHPRLWEAHERLVRHHRAVIDVTAGLLRALAPPKEGRRGRLERGGDDARRGFRRAIRFLRELAPTDSTGMFNVLVMKVPDVRTFLEELRLRWLESAAAPGAISRVTPVTHAFEFTIAEEFEAKAREAALTFVPVLRGKTFHVRLHRRGHRRELPTPAELLRQRLVLVYDWYAGMVNRDAGRFEYLYLPDADRFVRENCPVREIATTWDAERLGGFLGQARDASGTDIAAGQRSRVASENGR